MQSEKVNISTVTKKDGSDDERGAYIEYTYTFTVTVDEEEFEFTGSERNRKETFTKK